MESKDIYLLSRMSTENAGDAEILTKAAAKTEYIMKSEIRDEFTLNLPAFVHLLYKGSFDKSFSYPASESGTFLMICCTGGGGRIKQSGRTYNINEGTLLLFERNQNIQLECDKSITAVILKLTGPLCNCFCNIFSCESALPILLSRAKENGIDIFIEKLRQNMSKSDKLDLINISGIISDLFSYIYRCRNNENSMLLSARTPPLWFTSAVAEMDKHPEKHIDAKSIAQKYGVSESTVYRAFSEFTALSPCLYLSKVRTEKAKILLTTTALQIKFIAARLGYKTVGKFIQNFKKETSKTPLAYRKENIS